MYNERERLYKRVLEILEVIEGYLKLLNSVKNCFILFVWVVEFSSWRKKLNMFYFCVFIYEGW